MSEERTMEPAEAQLQAKIDLLGEMWEELECDLMGLPQSSARAKKLQREMDILEDRILALKGNS